MSNTEPVATPALIGSWQRCQKLMQAQQWRAPHRAAGATFQSICQRKNDLLVLGQAALEDAYEYMESRHCVLLILDESGCTLWQCGHPQTMSQLKALGIDCGSYWAEGLIGTNAPALAIAEGHPIQVSGQQHFKQALHPWHFCATPVYDNSGRQRAVIVLGSLLADNAASDLPLTLAIAREIGNYLHADTLLAETNRHLNELNALLDGVEDGVMAWDQRGCLLYLNRRAAAILQLNETNSLGKPVTDLLTLPAVLTHAILQRIPLSHVEVTFENQQQFIPALLTLKPIPDGDRCGFIALLHPQELLRQMVNNQLGRASYTFDDMPVASLEMRRLIRYGKQAAKGRHPILLHGEEGVGKQQLGQAIHNASNRASGPYIVLNCQALPQNLMAREFLGSDASEGESGQPSKFELANGGTLYLEQVEYLSPEMQSALLQIVKTGMVMRVNSNRVIPVDVRIITATGADLPLLVKQGRFRRQLFYTLQSFELHIPPLRQRQQDIPLLVQHTLTSLGQHFHCQYQPDESVIRQLCQYPWPGNDQELKSVVERAAMACRNNRINLNDLPEHLLGERLLLEPDMPQPQPVLSLQELERQAIIRAALVCQGQLNEMATLLGIGRTTLWRKVKLHRLDIHQFKGGESLPF
ncbi:TPA: PTS-dependent dihydroxyacetone kinase operon transcriptional regulator DhaR [Yersinia enterocolitica]|uniref:dihydroxyacetone kinase operon transcriptional regulator DhaR n=1 Tax=Yersinia enterocolitica TaxID=630 RepID=UPI00065A826D|nr:dihydroxyacetone kinase operon transcriptional regulator DhaR [Yersinia enterocolitica]CRY03954.1 DNA-binding transcriptional regulator DhaR [Yersinia enterocolitica]HDM8288514.1 PTS-dependent dihydroxyacetone kinase operon transcriptional regulator DhaR [Yersinia enterocolitica]HDM8292532.1 PTS-dependent dihydroxyacetone kinase operon transcriptional regulator DhaR [Yersinia enterocolitica]HDM8317883.1 PTS-dependent dihydroxyacetone kinase operon transcriptional regulator DhaR [Yersinia ent